MNNIAGNKTDMGNQNLGFQKSNGSTARISNWFLKFSMVALFILMIGETSWGQVDGDYQTLAAGNWDANTTWQVRSGGAWVNCAVGDYPGVAAGAGTVTILNSHNVTLNVSPANAIGALSFANGTANATSLNITGNTLNITGAFSFGNPTGNNGDQTLTVGTGTLNCASITMPETGANGEVLTITISSGTINSAGSILMQTGTPARNVFTATGSATVNIGGNFTGGTFNAGTSTVNYNGAGAQNVGNYTYFNLATSTGGIKTLPAANINITGTLSVNGSTLAFDAAAARTIAVTGNLSGDGTINMSPGSRAHILNLGGATNSIGTLTTAAVASVINYNRAGDQTVFESANYRNITISGSGIKTLQGDAGIGVNLNIAAGTFNLGTSATTINIAGTATATGILDYGTTTDKTVTVTGDFTLAATGTVNMSGSSGNILNLRGATNTYTAGGSFTAGVGNQTVNYDGDLAQTVMQLNYRNLRISNYNAASLTPRTKTLSGASSISGNLTVDGVASARTTFAIGNNIVSVGGNLNVDNYGTTTLGTQNFTVTGQTNIGANGSLTDAGAGTNLFIGSVLVDINGVWNVPQPCTFRGGLTVNSASFTSATTYTFDTNDQTLDGTASFTLNNVALGTAGKTLTNANTSGVTIAGTFTGAGNFTNGTPSANAILFLTATSATPIVIGTLDLTSNPNTVNYAGAGAQTIAAYSFYNLSSSAAGARTLANGGTINILGTFTPGTNAYTITGNTVNFNGTAAQSIPPAFTFNNLTVSGASTKTLTGNVTVNGVINLNGAVLECDAFNLQMIAATTITGAPYSLSNMIATSGIGYLQRTAASAAGFQILYPIGSGGYYSPMTISSIAALLPAYIRVRAVPTAINPSYIKKYWDVQSNVALNNVTATFEYEAGELNGALPSISYSPDAGVTWQNPPSSGASSFGGNSFTITGNTPFTGSGAPFRGYWTMGYRTFYSYQTGSWNTPTTWTSDPSGSLQIGSTIPGYNDKVVILAGRTVSLASDIAVANIDITIDDGGFLNLGTYRFTNLPTNLLGLRGQGTLQLATVNFPTATTNTLVGATGGTVEYNNTANFTLPTTQTIYHDLVINTTAGVIATEMNNLTLSGNLYIKQGVFQINDNASTARRELTVTGNLTVDATGEIAVGTGNTNQASIDTPPFKNYYDQVSHRVIIYGDFTNSGKVRFTNLTFPIYNVRATNGYATVYFQGNTDNTITCDGQTDFYNLVLDKGSDQTYKLTINPSAYSNFRLFGANYAGGDQIGATPENPNIYKALWIRNGSLVLTGFTVIPSLTEGTGGGNPNADYFIPANSALILDNPNVIVLVTADDYKEVNAAYGVSGGTGLVNGVLNSGSLQALSILGTVQVNDGYLSTRESSGIVTWNYASGQIVINGGIVDVKQLRSGSGGAGKSSFLQNGGLFILRGRFQRTPAAFTSPTDLAASSLATLNTARVVSTADGSMGTFSLTDPGNVFSMSGGTIRIYDGIGSRVFDVFSSAGNINVTGGTLELIPTTGSVLGDQATWDIASYAPLYNILIDRPSSTTTVRLSPNIVGPPAFNATSLIVKNNLTLNTAAFNANNLHVVVGGNFSVSLNSTYTTGTNWTILNGTGAQTLTVNTAAALAFNKFKIEKIAGTTLTLAGTQTNISVADSLMIVSGNLADGGKTIDFAGTIATASYLYSAGTHSGAGKIRFSDNVPQVIDGDGNGIFQNLELINTNAGSAPISLANNITVNGTLTFSNDRLFDIKTYNLKMNSAASFVGTSATRYVKTAGTLGDGGITRVYSTPAAFTFPVGTTSTRHAAAAAYTPATIILNSAPTTYGSISVAPVGYEHPTTTNNGRSLTYFWRVKSSGFTLGSATITHGYTYDQADVVTGANITEDGYIAARYNSATATWSKGTITDVDEATNLIGGVFLTNKTFIDGDYTAGDNTPTDPFGTPTTYYSRINGAAAGSGLWSDVNTWSTASHTGSVAASIPGPNDIVIIGAKDSIYLSNEVPQFPLNNTNPAATYYQLNKAWVSCALLQIEVGSALDIQNNPACTFGIVANHPNGNGNFRLTTRDAANFDNPKTYVFPAGDFTDFNVNRGTTEFYTVNPQSGTYFMLPNNVNSYGNVILTPLKGSNLILPNINYLTIYGDLVCKGSDADAWLAMTWNGAYGAIVQKTVYVKGNFDIDGGSFGFIYNGATLQNIIVDGNVTVAPKAGIDVWATSTNNKMSIGGNLINNSDNSTAPQGTPSIARFSNIDLTFFGPNIASVTNTVAGTPTTTFNKVTINKGSSQATTLTVNIGGTLNTPTDNWLTLQNGTLRYMRTNPNSDFTISQGTAFTIPSSAGLYVDYANSGNRNILIANAASGTNDLFLNGKLTLIRGNIYVGQIAAPNNDNDIEYSGGGASAIEVQGGQLVVNGQIRRNLSSTVGVLSYTQSGGTVSIIGNNANLLRGKLEVCNTGSSFTMSNGTLNIVRGGGSTFGDLYLRPASSSITGGTIVFSQTPSVGPVVDLPQNYTLESNVALNNLTITGKTAGTARTATVGLSVSPLTVNGDFTLNLQSIFNSNNRDVTIKGNMANSGTYNAGTNTTTFSGITQSITGTTPTFNNLTVTSSGSLTATANNFSVNGNLSISNGNLVLSNIQLTLKGNLAVNSAYTDNNIAGSGVSLQGTSEQQISGVGQFGRLELKNITGAKLLNDISLQNNLILAQGVLNIKQYGLTMGQTSTFTGSAAFGLTNMIITDGVTSSAGLQKYFSPGANTFVYPIGVTGKYTPATLTITANSTVGYVAINPVNSNHPLAVDPANVLKYYWKIESIGISNFAGNLVTKYSPGDVGGIESDYIAANLLLPGTYWSKATTGSATDRVDESIHQISFPIVATNNITGEYTAGIDAALPDEVATYRSNKDGVWTDGTIWDPVGSSPPCPAGGPSGVGVIVDHEVSITSNYASAYSTTINGKLKVISPTFGHNLGNVDGSGTLYLESGNLPAGNYDAVATCESDATIEFGGSGTYTLASTPYTDIPNLFFTGSGTRVLSNKDITICHRLVIDGPTLDNSVSNRKLTILGTMERYNTGVFLAGSGVNATVSFAGSSPQIIGGTLGNFNGGNSFSKMEINNSYGLTIQNSGVIQLTGNLLLTNGNIITATTNGILYLNSPSNVIPAGGSSASFVDGPLKKYITSGSNFLFPVGKGINFGHPITVTSNAGGSQFWTVEFFTPNLTANALTAPLAATNTEEYWKVYTTAVSNAKVKIGWDSSSDLTPAMTTNGIIDMRVAEYNTGTSKWEQLTSTTSGNAALGDVATTNNVSIPVAGKDYTTASVTTTKPLAALNPTGAVCGGAGIPVKFTSFNPITLPYSLDYTLDGVAQTTITVNSLPYTLPTPAAGTYQLTGFKYNGATISGVVSSTSVTSYATPTTANAGPDQAACGITTFTLKANRPVAPSTGLWSIVSGTGGNINYNTSDTTFIGGAGKSYILRWTISNGGCKSTDDVAIGFPVAPQRPSNFTAAPKTVCQNSNNVYTVPSVPATTYNWSYSGTGASIGGTPLTAIPITGLTNSVTINFNATATGGTISVTATNACGTSAARTVAITVLPLPDAAGTITGDTPICQGTNGVAFSVGAITNATGYTWSLPAGASIASGANTNSITVDFSASAVSGNITVMGTNACGNGVVSPNFAVVVNNPPTIALTNANPIVCAGITTASITYGVTTNSPNLYSIDFDAIAQGQGFRDTSNVTLSSPINFKVPAAPAAGTYNANLTVTNSTTGCVSQSYPITITVNASPIASWTSPLIHSVCALQTGTLFSVTNVAGCTYTWTVESGAGVVVGSGNSVTVDWADNATIFSGMVVTLNKKVSVVVTETITGCTTTLEQTIPIHRLPETGPQYHVPNTFAQ